MKKLLREIHLNKKVMLYLFLGMALFFSLRIGYSSFLGNFSSEQQWTLVLLAIAMMLWITTPIPTGVSSILILALMLIFGLVQSIDEAVVGFLSPALYFILMLSIISQALVKVGIDKIIARFLFKISKGGPRFIIIGLPLFILVLPILLPSAVARFKMLFPLISRLNSFYGLSDKSLFKKYCVYVIGMMNQNATMIIYTGGGFPILASQLIRDYHVAELGWSDWFLLIAPPLWLGSLVVVVFVWQFLIYHSQENLSLVNVTGEIEEQHEPIPTKIWLVVFGFLAMIITWIITDQQRVPLLLPPMLFVVFLSLPKIGLVTNKVIREFDWENFLLLGASFSLGMLIEANGTATVLASQLLEIIPEHAGTTLKVIIIAVIIFILRFFFIMPSSAMIVIFPIVISYSTLIGIPPLQLAFLIVMVIGSMMILPIHATTTYLAFETDVLTKKEHYTIGIISSLFFMVIAIVAALFYW
ncbi:SLC13 family permease [Ornithinibacillus sp. L9]|uniref:SLC13 family permease n=1 Tax=Ornithinibacillus caprae TaxID=2678566 RepID=A0A6N8FPR0_9BACI|nr:SLC13 family permease [Ornithinibacillus caprae]MUK90157.1 SLC13 family permease [Ornithinibacillus caprae]